MKVLNILIIIFFLCCAWISCNEKKEKKNISEYYFPIAELLKKGKIYEYRAVGNDTLPPEYWYHQGIETDTGLFLVSNYYDNNFINRQYVKNEVVSNGVLVLDYFFLNPGGEQNIQKAKIQKNNVFLFDVHKEGGVLVTEFNFLDPADPQEKITFKRERKYISDTIHSFKDEDIPAIIFHSNEIRQFTHPQKGDFDNTTVTKEIYAKNIGLISRQYKIANSSVEYSLFDIYDFNTFEKMANSFWEQEVDITPIIK